MDMVCMDMVFEEVTLHACITQIMI
jgi:hypothetical protein